MIEESQAISAFSALAQETRLKLIRELVRVGEGGRASGDLARTLGVSAASMSFHLGQLEQAGLVIARRQSRSIIYSADFERLGGLIAFLLEDCCGGNAQIRNCC